MKRPTRRNTAAKPKIRSTFIGTTGDADPLEHGGGVVFRNRYGVQWWFWQEPVKRRGQDTTPQTKYRVFRANVPKNVFLEHYSASPKAVANWIGADLDEVLKDSKSKDAMNRVFLLEKITEIYNLDSIGADSETYTRAELKRLFPGRL